MFAVNSISGKLIAAAQPGALLIDVLAAAGVMPAESPCGRKGICMKCLVEVRSGTGWSEVLACQTTILSDIEVRLPTLAAAEDSCLAESSGAQVELAPAIRKVFIESLPLSMALCWEELCLVTGIPVGQGKPTDIAVLRDVTMFCQDKTPFTAVLDSEGILGVEQGDTCNELYGMAFDIGTTTVVGYLLSLADGRVAATVSALNPQVRYGADVVTRITTAEQEPTGLAALRGLIGECINDLIGQAAREANVPCSAIYDLVFVGNPCMQHLFLGISPAGLGRAPYQPVLREPVSCKAVEAGLKVNFVANIYWLPGVAGFVGADTVGMLVAYRLDQGTTLALDIGTNGEMVLAHEGKMWACSTAAGPAFEGTSMTCGLRAQTGAIDRVWLQDNKVCFTVIGEAKPCGICGSGTISAIAAMLKAGLIDTSGKIVGAKDNGPAVGWLVEKDGAMAFLIAPGQLTHDGRDIVVTQKDIRELQLAKAAIAAGFKMLLKDAGLSSQEIQRVVLAGAFGLHLCHESIRTIGLIPDCLCGRIDAVGNAAGRGAQHALLSAEARQYAVKEARRIHYIELAGRSDFSNIFVDELFFP